MKYSGESLIGRVYSPETAQVMCFGKFTYKNKNAARDAGVSYGNNPYKCPICREWHLTNLNNKAGNRAKTRARM